jgi:hypothetical protein
MAVDRYGHYLRDGQLPVGGHPELLVVMPHLRSQQSVNPKPRMAGGRYRRERGLCPGVITDKVHLPSPTVLFSVPVVIYMTEGGLNIEFSSSGVLPPGTVIDDGGAHAEAVEVEIHDGVLPNYKGFRG